MIAWAGAERLALGMIDTMDAAAARALAARRQRHRAGGLCQLPRGILRSEHAASFNSVAVIGAGAWGTALASASPRARARDVTLYARDADHANADRDGAGKSAAARHQA